MPAEREKNEREKPDLNLLAAFMQGAFSTAFVVKAAAALWKNP
ncbi:MAG: hypothetical protein RRY20_07325 [Bilophila sp.]